jgi:penicillin-binding protein 2
MMIPASRRRLFVLYLLVFAMVIALVGRLWYLQVMSGTHYKALAAANQTRDIVVPAVRGSIVDDTGNALVTNDVSLVVSVNMMILSQTTSDDGMTVLKRLAPLLHTSYRSLSEQTRLCTKGLLAPCWSGSPYQPIPVAENVSDHIAETGFAGDDLVGQAGLEAQYNSALTGKPGTQVVLANAAGDVTGTVSETPPANGDTLVTSLNAQLQSDVQSVLASAVAKARAEGNNTNQGAAIVETTSGRIVAMASYPDYNPNIWTNGISQSEYNELVGTSGGEPIINWATQGQYAPGSTFKITSTAAAVADGYSLNGLYNCPATISIDGQTFANDGEPDLGDMSLAEALIQSCDTVFYDLGYQMWQTDDNAADFEQNPHAPTQKMQQMELDWGFGKYTGVDLPEGNTGVIPTRQWLYDTWKANAHAGLDWCKYGNEYGSYDQQIEYQDCQDGWTWEPGQAAIAAIGQGYIAVTPLQLANAYTALANGGTLYEPRIGEALVSPSGKVVQEITPPVASHLPVGSYTLAYIRSALAGVVTQGTAAGAFSGFPLNQVCVAGKTGTAQNFGVNASSVFASFAPCQNPKYVVIVIIPDAGYGADVAAPAVRQIWDDIYGLEGHKAALPGGNLPSLPKKIQQ